MLNKKLNISNNLKRGIAGLLSLSLAFGVFQFPNVAEASAVKTKTVTFSEQLDGNNRSQNVNIPDVSQIVGTRIVGGSTNGSSSATITGTSTVKVNVSGGSPSRTANNPYKYSQYVTDYSTSSSNNFSSSKYYNNGGYTGYLNASGGSWVTSGSYTPGDSKYVTGQTSSWYNDGTYSGSLSSYVYSGSYTPADSKYVTYKEPHCYYPAPSGFSLKKHAGGIYDDPYYYNKDGYSGYIPREYVYLCGAENKGLGNNYRGTVTRPASDTRVYRYQGTVTKPTIDTRQWRQDYAGTVYKAGVDNFYSYTVEVDYIDDITAPTITHSLSTNLWTKGNVTINVSATDSQSGVKNITLPNGTVVNGTSASYTVSSNGVYTFYATDNANNKTNAYNVTITNIDKTSPTNGDLNFKPSKNGEMTYAITNSVETGSGLKDKPVTATITSETKAQEVINSALTNIVTGFSGNEKINIKYTLTDNVGNISNSTAIVSKYSFAKQPTLGELRGYTGDSITFKYEHPIQHNDAKYRFKAVSSTGEEVLSSVYDYDSLVTITGLKKNVEYTIYATAINNDNVYNEYVKLRTINKDGLEEDLKATTKNQTQITTSKSEGFNKHTFVANVKDIDLDKMKAELVIGDKVILLDDTLYKTNVSESRVLNINLDNTKNGVSRSIEGVKDIFVVGVNLPNGKYPVVLRTTKSGDVQNLELGTYGIDTQGPVMDKPNITYLVGGRGLLTINTSSIKDLSSHLSEIQMDFGNGYEGVRAQAMTNKEIKTLKLKDKLGNISTIEVTQNNSFNSEADNNPDNPNDNDNNNNGNIPDNVKDGIITVDVPSGGTHMQTSLDGVTWSNWEARTNRVTVTLSTGDGLKSVYVRTGVQKFKETPVFNTETGRVEFISQEGGDIEPLNNTRIHKFVMDLTAPKLKIRTMDNSLIAINGNIIILMDIVDNLDISPKFTVELLERDGNGVLETKAPDKRTFSGTTGTNTTGRLTLSKLPELRTSSNKLQPYTLKVTAFDKYGNKTVEHLNFYSKTKS